MLTKQIPVINFRRLKRALPQRIADSHKGDYGHVLVVGGDYGYAGAPVMSALGAMRAGAGLVTIITRREHALGLHAVHPELMVTVAENNLTDIRSLMQRAAVIVIGPGLGRSEWSRFVFELFLTHTTPMVIDADGLYFLAQKPQNCKKWILTPHPGEAAMLLNAAVARNSNERLEVIQELINIYEGTTVLKGYGTLVGSSDSLIEKCRYGNPGMATAGMGDLLSGIIAGLVAQGIALDVAAKLGVCAHALAGDTVARRGMRGIIATDLLEPLRNLLN